MTPTATENEFLKLYVEKASGRRSARWVAIWRTERGNFIHDTLPIDSGKSYDTAETYAKEHKPTW